MATPHASLAISVGTERPANGECVELDGLLSVNTILAGLEAKAPPLAGFFHLPSKAPPPLATTTTAV